MAGFRILDIVKPFSNVFPEVYAPYDKIQFDDKIIYTVITGLIYLFLQQLPIVGYYPSKDVSERSIGEADPFYYIRNVFAMGSPHSIVEFGLFPIIFTSILLQLLSGLKMIRVNFLKKQERFKFQNLNKFLTIALTIALTNYQIFIVKYYGSDLTVLGKILINLQIFSGSLLTLLFVEIIDKGYGFQSGILCLQFLSYTTTFVNNIIGITTVVIDKEGNKESQGCLINMVTNFRSSKLSWSEYFLNVFTRSYLPNLSQMIGVAFIGILVIYWSHYRYELTIRSTKTKNASQNFPIKMLYTGGLSIFFSYSILTFLNIIILIFIKIFGLSDKFIKYDNNNTQLILKFPFNLLTPPKTIFPDLLPNNLLQLFVFPLFFISLSIWFSYKWMLLSGSSPTDLAAQFKEQGITIQGKRESAVKQDLMKHIKPAAVSCGLVLGGIVCLGELLGLKGDAAGMVLAVASCFSLLELIAYEFQQSSGNSMFANILGGL